MFTGIPSSLSCINEYLTIDSAGNVSELSSRAVWVECIPDKSTWCCNDRSARGEV